ncbi:L-seryl-tRNA(Sec) kinase [Eupeodes corollae]|uniref:L-seryl-tRNA(Sec) kinase n=1 Tax=Eupeodes corollae TaxID=290404 RepID=UPI002492DF09|nr:L-seryl-tRNA(Sec) kinase [Eupeodes corollae]
MVNICVIALIGLPGAGKTTFCKNMVKLCDRKYNIIHICYDEIFHFHPETEKNEHTFKNERKKVAQKIEQIVIDEIKSSNTCQDNQESCLNSSNKCVLLVDDNNYYAGMRYEIYKICRRHQVSFGQIYFPIGIDIALARNSMREQDAIHSDVLIKMNKRLEGPSGKNHWEKNTLVINNSVDVEEFWEFLKACFLNPVRNKQENKDDTTTEVSFIHEVDICLRRRIKELLQNTDENPNEKAITLNKRRKCILLELKNNNDFDDISSVKSIYDRLTL